MQRALTTLISVLIIMNTIAAVISFSGSAQSYGQGSPSVDITSACVFSGVGPDTVALLTDNDEGTTAVFGEATGVVIAAAREIGGVYIKFDRTPSEWVMICDGESLICGTHGFLHEYVPLPDGNGGVMTLCFPEYTEITDIFILSKGESLPSFVQVWRAAEGKCDIMLSVAHSDDDQIFFAGSVPDAVARGAEMQVCYFTNHWNTHTRPHELLNGLWACGLDRYPVIGELPDLWSSSEKNALKKLENEGFEYSGIVASQVALLRAFKPEILLLHDINGEYGHGAHRLASHTMRDAVEISADPEMYPESAEKYGVWDVPKTYIHLYEKNGIEFEIDTPLEYFGGRTAYQVSQDAFRCHISQFGTRYKDWLIGTDEEPITDSRAFPDYSPRYYGLWRTLVGEDVIRTDFYENISLLSGRDITHFEISPFIEPVILTTEPTTEPATDPLTEPTTYPATEPLTEPTTEPATEPLTESTTEPTSEPATDPTAYPATEPVTHSATEPLTEPLTVPEGASADTSSAPVLTRNSTEKPGSEGKESALPPIIIPVAAGALILFAVIAVTAVVKTRRK